MIKVSKWNYLKQRLLGENIIFDYFLMQNALYQNCLTFIKDVVHSIPRLAYVNLQPKHLTKKWICNKRHVLRKNDIMFYAKYIISSITQKVNWDDSSYRWREKPNNGT